MKLASARLIAALVLLFAVGAMAQTTNDLSDAEIQGRQLARQLLEQRPTNILTNSGILQIRDGKGKLLEISADCWTTSWGDTYEAGVKNHFMILYISHNTNQLNKYFYWTNSTEENPLLGDSPFWGKVFNSTGLSGPELMIPLANSDFWICDLGLEFFHWPDQKILKRENARGRICKVLESTNPDPSTNGYSRVDSWIDEETLGIVEAKAYDSRGKLLKEFFPKDFKKVDGQWQVGMMEMNNVQTGSRSRIEFDLKK